MIEIIRLHVPSAAATAIHDRRCDMPTRLEHLS
jgi:hypothetical protein